MTSLLLTGIAELVTNDPDARRHPARPGRGRRGRARGRTGSPGSGRARRRPDADAVRDLGGRAVIPGFVDSHSHLVFAGDRAAEFAARMAGESYTGGGIRTTVAATRAATDEQLDRQRRAARRGDAAPGHHHRRDQERLRAHRARRGAQPRRRPPVHRGDHLPRRPRRAAGVRRGPGRLRRPRHRPDAGRRGAARAVDRRLLRARCLRRRPGARRSSRPGGARGLQGRLHANQLGPGPGVQLACELGLTAVDHCTFLDDADVAALADSRAPSRPCCPGVEFSTRSPYPDARGLLDAGVTVALATDCNPGSCYTSSMPLCVALAVREMRMTPAEALWSATAGGARALGRDDVGVARAREAGPPRRAGGAVVPPPRLPSRGPAGRRRARLTVLHPTGAPAPL